MKIKLLIVALCFVYNFSFSKELSDFEKMLSGFPECKFDGVYLDLETLAPQHRYFKDRDLRPEKIEGYLAKFTVNESYYGLHVSEIYIPADTLFVVAIVIDEKKKIVERKLEKILINGYNKEFVIGVEDPAMILVPDIQEHKVDKTKTVMSCINPV